MNSKTMRRVVVELLIVVFGILIAVAVDRWNQSRQERAAARNYVEALADDLASDTASLGALVQIYREREAAARRVLDAIGSDSDYGGNTSSLARDIGNAGYVTAFETNDFTYRELLSTGGLGLIKDPDIKHALVAYYQSVQFFAQFYPLWNETPLAYYIPEVRARVSPTAWMAIESGGAATEGNRLDAGATLDALRQGGVVEKLLVSIKTSLGQQASSHGSLRTEAIDLLRLLATPSG